MVNPSVDFSEFKRRVRKDIENIRMFNERIKVPTDEELVIQYISLLTYSNWLSEQQEKRRYQSPRR